MCGVLRQGGWNVTKSIASCRNVGTLYREEPDDPGSKLGGILLESLDIPLGGIIAILGESGSGKSTLLSLLGGLKAPNVVAVEDGLSRLDLLPDSDWEVQLLCGAQPDPGTLGFVFQESHLMKALPVGLNLEMARSLTTAPMSDSEFAAMMTAFGFGVAHSGSGAAPVPLRDKRVASLSGGQQQRIAVGRAVSSDPRLIFCDEPTSSLDRITARKIMGHLSDWARSSGGTVLWITHDEDLAEEYADGLLYISKGQVISDGGRPFAIGADMARPARRDLLAGLKLRAADLLPLTEQRLADLGMRIIMAKGEVRKASEPARSRGRHRPYDGLSILRFIWHFVIAELFERQSFPQGRRGWAARVVQILWRGPYSFSKPTFTLVLLLGMMTFYVTFIGYSALNSAFGRSLSRPEVSHFMLETRAKEAETTNAALSRDSLKKLSDNLSTTFASEIAAGARAPKAYGRREDLFASVRPVGDNGCADNPSRSSTAALLVFQRGEPLYGDLQVSSARGITPVSGLGQDALKGQALVTSGFLQRALGRAPDDAVPGGFCLGEESPVLIEIAGIVSGIPGSKDLQFDFTMTDDTYLRAMATNEPESWGGKRPPYMSAALYFDAAYAESLFCNFDRCDTKAGTYSAALGATYKLNVDALDQIRKLVGIAVASRSVLFGVIATMLGAVAIAIVLSVKAFIATNERFLCIMRAVGYRRRHLTLLFLLEFLFITLAAALLFGVVLMLVHGLAVSPLVDLLGIDPIWLAARPAFILGAVGAVYCLVAFFGLLIMMEWWWRIRYVGQKLQGL